jgi:inhibitor of growth protein 3
MECKNYYEYDQLSSVAFIKTTFLTIKLNNVDYKIFILDSMDSIEKKVKVFFSNAKKMKPNEKEVEYEVIRKEYYKTLEDADEKVHLANQMYDLVDRYLRRLDQELHKFKMELEADNKGITEILEKRSLELDQPSTNSSQKENRYSFTSSRSRDNHSHCK